MFATATRARGPGSRQASTFRWQLRSVDGSWPWSCSHRNGVLSNHGPVTTEHKQSLDDLRAGKKSPGTENRPESAAHTHTTSASVDGADMSVNSETDPMCCLWEIHFNCGRGRRKGNRILKIHWADTTRGRPGELPGGGDRSGITEGSVPVTNSPRAARTHPTTKLQNTLSRTDRIAIKYKDLPYNRKRKEFPYSDPAPSSLPNIKVKC